MTVVAGAAEWHSPEKVEEVMRGNVREANVAWWGFDAGDSTAYLQAALDSGASKVVVPNVGKPWVVKPLIVQRDNLEVHFEEGVVVEAKRGEFQGRNDVLLKIHDRKNIALIGYGAILQMHKRDYWQEPYRRSEWRHAVDVRGSNGIIIQGLTIRNSGGDGIYIGTTKEQNYVKDVVIRDVVCDGNNRQGISVISAENLLVENGVFSNTIGTAPMAGIDIEPNKEDQRAVNIVIRNCVFHSNSQLGMHIWLRHLSSKSQPVSVVWEDNYVSGGEIGIHVGPIADDGPGGSVVFRNNIVEDTHYAGILVRRVSATSGVKLKFENNFLINTAHKGPHSAEALEFYGGKSKLASPSEWWSKPNIPSAPIVLAAHRDTPKVQGGIEFDGGLIIHNLNEPNLIIYGPSSRQQQEEVDLFDGNDKAVFEDGFIGWSDIRGKLRVINPYGSGISIRTPVENFDLKIN